MKVAILQTHNIQELETKLQQQIANMVTDSGGSIPGRVLAIIDTNTSGGGSMTSTVTKEELMQMFAQFTKNFKPGQSTKIDPTGNKVTKKKN